MLNTTKNADGISHRQYATLADFRGELNLDEDSLVRRADPDSEEELDIAETPQGQERKQLENSRQTEEERLRTCEQEGQTI